MSNSENFRKNVMVQGSILAMASIIVRLIGLVYRIPLTRVLGDTAMGYYGYAYEIYNLALILSSYSMPLAVSKLVSARLVKKEYKNSHRVFTFTMAFSAIVGAVMSLLLIAFAEVYAKIIKCPGVIIPLRILAPTIFVFSVMGVIRGYFQGYGNMVPTAISQVFEQIVNAVVSILAAYLLMKANTGDNQLSWGAGGGTLGTFSGALAAFISLVLMYAYAGPLMKKKRLKDSSTTVESNKYICKVLLLTAIPVIVSQTIYQISGTLDSVIYNAIEGKTVDEVTRSTMWGIYSNKYRLLTNVPVAVASAMGTAIVPSLIAEFVVGRYDALKEKIASVVKFNMIIAFPSAVGMSVLAHPILLLLFRDNRHDSTMMLRMGGICIIFFALSTVTNGVLQGINKMRLPVIHSAISLAIHVPLLIIMLKFMNLGAYSLVICNVIFPLVVCILNWRSIGKLIDYKQEVVRTFVIPCASSLLMGAITFGIYKVFALFAGNFISTMIALMAAVLSYFFFLIKLGGVTKEEMLKMPKGRTLVNMLSKIGLFKA